MSSILTNVGAMVALQNLQSINKNLAGVQGEISTGKSVANAKDNSAVWAISKVMESDVAGFKAIGSSLALGESTVSVARQASETVTDLLTQMKDKIVASQEENVDRAKIQTDITALKDQISAVVGAAQFNGLNLLSNKGSEDGSGSVNILSSLDRSATGVATNNITVGKQDLGTEAAVLGTTAVGAAGELVTVGGATVALNDGTNDGTQTVSFTSGGATAGASYRITLTGNGANELGTTPINFDYVARDGDTDKDVSDAIVAQMNDYAAANELGLTSFSQAGDGTITISNADTTTGATIGLAVTETLEGSAAGGLNALNDIDVTDSDSASAALTSVESLIQTAIDSAASFGSAQKRIETQSDFVSGLSDALKAGIGTLVDANMEEASARLQALQVQQQLGVQALSIANQAPQSLLSLFR